MRGIDVQVLRPVDGGVEVGSEGCVCGECRPTATIFPDDPGYERHDPKLAQGPCCCGRFFVVGHDAPTAERRATDMSERKASRRRPRTYVFEHRPLQLATGETFEVVVADFAPRVHDVP